ncbi:LCP family protein [Microbacterium gorillae]|uniref:LCP family protein n=1 Tax=Microbacterium gorillae TaxID=1231063 RepID=UPI003D9637F2
MTRWGAQLPPDGSANSDPTGTASGEDDGDVPTIDRAQLAEERASAAAASSDDVAVDDDATISREVLEQLRNARRDAGRDVPNCGVDHDAHDHMHDHMHDHVAGDELDHDIDIDIDIEETVSRTELDERRTMAEPAGTPSPPRLRRDARAASDTSSPAERAERAHNSDTIDGAAYFRDASTIPYATLLSLRAAPAGDSDTTPFDVRTVDENVATRSIRLPLPAAELARVSDEGDVEEDVPEETLPAPVTHQVAVSVRTGAASRTSQRTSTGPDDPTGSTIPAPRPAAENTVGDDATDSALAPARPRFVTAPRRIVALWIVVAVALMIALSVIVKPGQVGSIAAGISAGRGETNILMVLADSSKDAADIASGGGADALAVAVVDFSADGLSVSSVSLRPDTWVAIPEHGEGTLSDALALGGAEALRSTLQDSLGIRIDHTIVITEPGLAALTRSGDLDIVNPSEVTTDRFTFPSGPLTLNPSTAVDYLQSDPLDLPRQQAVLDGAARLLIGSGVSKDAATTDAVAVLPAFNDEAVEQLTAQLRAVDASGIVYGIAATSDAERDSRSVAALDGAAWQKLRAAFAADDVASHLRSGTSR